MLKKTFEITKSDHKVLVAARLHMSGKHADSILLYEKQTNKRISNTKTAMNKVTAVLQRDN